MKVFDPTVYLEPSPNGKVMGNRSIVAHCATLPANDLERVKYCIEQLTEKNIDLTATDQSANGYDKWVRLGYAFKPLGEKGRELFHSLSEGHPDYTPDGCNAHFDAILNNSAEGKEKLITLGTFYKMCADHGVNIATGSR